jgi:hypothetical protein
MLPLPVVIHALMKRAKMLFGPHLFRMSGADRRVARSGLFCRDFPVAEKFARAPASTKLPLPSRTADDDVMAVDI